MAWKNVIASLSILVMFSCLADENQDHIKEKYVPQIANIDHVRQLLSGIIERNQQHRARVLKLTSSQSPPVGVFDPLLEGIQSAINARIDKISGSSTAEIPLSIDQETQLINSLWMGISSTPSTKIVSLYCKKVMDKAKNDIKNTTNDTQKRTIIQDVWNRIGQIVFLAGQFPNEMPSLVVLSSLPLTQQKIEKRCNQELQKVILDCQHYEELQKECGLEEPGLSLSFYKAQKIAQILLTSSGKLNLGMISLVRAAFIPKTSPLEYEVGMDRVLTSMNSSWQPTLTDIVKPEDHNTVSPEVIRGDLGLSRGTTLTDYHSKLTALKALLCQLCQGAVGDCFAVSWAIKKHNEYLLQSLKDYGELLQAGYLTRIVDGRPDVFFFKNTLADDDLQNSVSLTAAGTLGNNEVNLSEVPAIVAGCRQMGIDDVTGATTTAIAVLFNRGSDPIQTSPEQILKSFAAYSVQKNPQLDLPTQIAKGKYGFSLTQNHLLRAWETALAGMAEAKKGDAIYDQVLLAIQTALNDQWPVWKAKLAKELQMLAGQMQSVFETTFDNLNRFVYDAAIPLTHISTDGNSSNGGFELYECSPDQPLLIGKRIATPQDFTNHLLQVIQVTHANLSQTYSSSSQRAALDQLADNLASYIHEATFLRDVFYAYDDANKKYADPVSNYQQLDNTPMTSLDGDNPYAVEAIDTGVTFLPDVKTITPQNTYELVKWILDLAQWKEQTQHYLEDTGLDELDSATSPQHAFNIPFEETEIVNFVKSKQSSDLWLQEQAIKPLAIICSTIIGNSTKQDFSSNIMGWLQKNAQLSNDAVNALNSSIAQINQNSMNIQTYSSSFLRVLTDSFQADDKTAKELSVAFDTIFLQSLPTVIVQQLSQHAVRFAKTNWNQGDKNLYFCAFFNPRTASLDFGTITEDRTDLVVMDEYQWVDEQTWEVIPIENAPF